MPLYVFLVVHIAWDVVVSWGHLHHQYSLNSLIRVIEFSLSSGVLHPYTWEFRKSFIFVLHVPFFIVKRAFLYSEISFVYSRLSLYAVIQKFNDSFYSLVVLIVIENCHVLIQGSHCTFFSVIHSNSIKNFWWEALLLHQARPAYNKLEEAREVLNENSWHNLVQHKRVKAENEV